MQVERDAEGDFVVGHIPAVLAAMLLRVPDLLESDDPTVRGRLLPAAYDDDDDEQQWRRHAVPELEHLFAERAELIRRDLMALAAEDAWTFRLPIPQRHHTAWVTGLNAARLALFELNEFEPCDMECDPADFDPDHELALVCIHALAHLEELLVTDPG